MKLLAWLALVFLAPGAADAAGPREVYRENRAVIRSRSRDGYAVGGCLFSQGSACVRSKTSTLARSKARLDAQYKLIVQHGRPIDWDASEADLDTDFKTQLTMEFFRLRDFKLKMSGFEILESWQEEKDGATYCRLVAGIPRTGVDFRALPRIRSSELAAFFARFPGARNELVYWELRRGRIPAAEMARHRKLIAARYGANIDRILRGELPPCSGGGAPNAADPLQTLEDALALLDRFPDDRNICRQVGELCERAHLKYMAEVFFRHAGGRSQAISVRREAEPASAVLPIPRAPDFFDADRFEALKRDPDFAAGFPVEYRQRLYAWGGAGCASCAQTGKAWLEAFLQACERLEGGTSGFRPIVSVSEECRLEKAADQLTMRWRCRKKIRPGLICATLFQAEKNRYFVIVSCPAEAFPLPASAGNLPYPSVPAGLSAITWHSGPLLDMNGDVLVAAAEKERHPAQAAVVSQDCLPYLLYAAGAELRIDITVRRQIRDAVTPSGEFAEARSEIGIDYPAVRLVKHRIAEEKKNGRRFSLFVFRRLPENAS